MEMELNLCFCSLLSNALKVNRLTKSELFVNFQKFLKKYTLIKKQNKK